MGIGNNIRTVRLAHNMTQKELAQKLNVKQTAVSYWETDKREPDFDTIKRICDIFSITYNELLDGNWKNYMEDIKNDFQNKDRAEISEQSKYYNDNRTAEIAQKIFDSKELSLLFDAAVDASPDDLQTAYDMLMALKRKEKGHY